VQVNEVNSKSKIRDFNISSPINQEQENKWARAVKKVGRAGKKYA